MVRQHYRSVLCVAILALLTARGASAQQLCGIVFDMENRNRHVVGEVNTECAPSPHSSTWGNWGVSSNFADKNDGAQFFGWKPQPGTWQNQWNSCTRDHGRDEDNIYYNHEHYPFNGFSDDQFSAPVNPYADDILINFNVECPMDWNSDGLCDTGGCLGLNYGVGVGDQFLSLYELDPYWPDGFVTTIYADAGCCGVTPSCTAGGCGPAESSWWPTTYSTDVDVTAEVRMKMQYAVFQDIGGYCEQLKMWDMRYQCY